MNRIKKREKDRMVLSYPNLVFKEFLCILAVITLFLLFSLFFNAPLEEMARPSETPNPAKAPWYFVGLQELLVYFDPWLGGVFIPLLIVMALLVIPYLEPNPETDARTTLRRRRSFGISMFTLGLLVWFGLILVGQFLRGPNWLLSWPWQAEEFVQRQAPQLWSPSAQLGILLICSYYGLGGVLPALIRREFYRRMGFIRYAVFMFLTLSLTGVVLKILLRSVFHMKYVLLTPWLNI